MPFVIFRRDHLRFTSGIICGSGSFAVQFGDHFRSGDHLRSGIICGAVCPTTSSCPESNSLGCLSGFVFENSCLLAIVSLTPPPTTATALESHLFWGSRINIASWPILGSHISLYSCYPLTNDLTRRTSLLVSISQILSDSTFCQLHLWFF